MTRLVRFFAVSLVSCTLVLTGCGVPERLVHLQPAPTENADVGAPLRADAAERIATRVLSQAALATSDEERQAVMLGPALRVAQARAAAGAAPAGDQTEVLVPRVPTVLAVSRGQDWPRAILATTLNETTAQQDLHVLVSSGPTAQFLLYASAPLLAGSSVPGLGEFADGMPFTSTSADEPVPVAGIFGDYAKGIAVPDPAEVSSVTVDDLFASSLRANAEAQQESLGDLGALAQTHAPIADSILSFETADGGQIAFGQMVRTDRITLSDKAKELKIEDATLQRLSGKKVVTKEFTAEFLENLIFVAPTGEAATLIGAEEVLLRAQGS